MSNLQKYLDPAVLNRLSRLELQARCIVEGFVSGMHESPYKGVSVEFAQHREYVPGDDPRHLDWKVFARSDRLYIKEYEQETNLRSTILTDFSNSMSYGSGNLSKLDYARFVAASLAYFIIQQRDSVKLMTFHDEVARELPESNSPHYIESVARVLQETSTTKRTNLGQVLNQVAGRLHHRGLVVLISDLLDDKEKIHDGIQRLRHDGHDVIILQILDPHEKEFPLKQMTRVRDLESTDELLVDPKALRQAYLKELHDHIDHIRNHCLANQVDYELITTDQRLDIALSTYLASREGRLDQ